MAPIPGTKGQSIITPPVNIAASITYCCRPLKARRPGASYKTRQGVFMCVCEARREHCIHIYDCPSRTPATHLSRTLSVKTRARCLVNFRDLEAAQVVLSMTAKRPPMATRRRIHFVVCVRLVLRACLYSPTLKSSFWPSFVKAYIDHQRSSCGLHF